MDPSIFTVLTAPSLNPGKINYIGLPKIDTFSSFKHKYYQVEHKL